MKNLANIPTYQEYITNTKKPLFLVTPLLGIYKNRKISEIFSNRNAQKNLAKYLNSNGKEIVGKGFQIFHDINGEYHIAFFSEDVKKANKIAEEYGMNIWGDEFHKTTLKNLPNILGFSQE